MKPTWVGLSIILLTVAATCQNIQVTGGDSSLFNATGGEVRASFAHSETDLSTGVLDGHAYVGVTQKMSVHGWDLTAGDTFLPFNLPTDLNANHLQFPAVGLGASRKLGDDKLTIFTGATATSYEVPFFFGSRAETPTAGVFYEHSLTSRLSFMSSEVVSTGKQSAIQSLRFKTGPTTLAMSAGVGVNSPFFSVRAGYETPEWTGIVAWTKHSPTFERIIVPNYSIAENNGLNLRGAYRGRNFNATVSRENLLSDIRRTIFNSTVDTVTAGASAGRFNANATAFYGTTNGRAISGETAGAAMSAGIFSGRVDAYHTSGTTTESVTVTEKLTRHLSVNQFVTGLHSVNAGAEYHSNSFTMSGGYSMSFFPALGIFQKVLSVSLSIQLPHNLRIDGGTVTTPDGKTRWTAYANSYSTHGILSDVQLGSNHSIGKYSYVLRFVTTTGEPVAGAARIGKTEVFCGNSGLCRLPTNKKAARKSVTVLVEDFLAAGKYRVVSAPTDIMPEVPAEVVVERR